MGKTNLRKMQQMEKAMTLYDDLAVAIPSFVSGMVFMWIVIDVIRKYGKRYYEEKKVTR